jgi:hypothetical protein
MNQIQASAGVEARVGAALQNAGLSRADEQLFRHSLPPAGGC